MKEERSIKVNLILLLSHNSVLLPTIVFMLQPKSKNNTKSIKQKQKARTNLSKTPTPVSNPNDLTPAKLPKRMNRTIRTRTA
jgi:hypothetical protein